MSIIALPSEKTKPFGIIYKITSPSGKSYIGQTKQLARIRLNDYKNLSCTSQPKIYAAIKKYGWENMKKEVLCECSSQEELNEKEKFYIKEFNSWKRGYNCDAGGIGHAHPEELRKKMSIAMSGEGNHMHNNNRTEKQREEHRLKLIGRKMPDWFADNQRENMRKQRMRDGPLYTGPASEESKKAVSEKQKKKWSDPEYRKKMSEIRKKNPIKKGPLDHNIYTFLNEQTLEKFTGNIREFYKKYDLDPGRTSYLAHGKTSRVGYWVLSKEQSS